MNYQTVQSGISIYPNPVRNAFTIDFGTVTAIQNANIKIYNELGQSQAIQISVEDGKIQLSTDAWVAGVYVIQLSIEGDTAFGQKTFRLLKL